MTAVAQRSTPTRLVAFAGDIKLSHSVFALPFALLSATLAARTPRADWGAWSFVLVVICMVCARTVAMAANRLLDAELDLLNPRTAGRAIPAGRVTKRYAAAMIALFAAGFVAATAGFWIAHDNPLPLLLSVPALAFLCIYPLLKRYTSLCHFYLGACLALAPVCAWIALTKSVAVEPMLMFGAVLFWTAGFDVIYATADRESDVQHGVHSLPARLGLGRALMVSRFTHVASLACLVALGFASPHLGALWFAAVGVVGVLLAVEHAVVRPDDLSRVNLAFFTLNGIISVLLGSAGIIDSALLAG